MRTSISLALLGALVLSLASPQIAIAKTKASTGPAAVALYYSGSKDGLKFFLFTDPKSPTGMNECLALLSGVTAQYKNKVPKMPAFRGLHFVKSACVPVSQYKK